MDYQIRLRVLEDGGVICDPSPGIPPGVFTVEGSDDGNRLSLSVVQRDAAGRFISSAHHVRDRLEETALEAVRTAEAVEIAVAEAVAEAQAAAEAEGM